ncbi:hypothetical protein EDB19DRAFT_1639685, partial [Suillus lakei]
TSVEARAKHRIAVLEDELQMVKQERGTKQRNTNYYIAQGRAICRMVVLYTSLEDLIAENDRRYEEGSEDATAEFTELDIDDCEEMLKKVRSLNFKAFFFALHTNNSKLKREADVGCGDDTSTLKDLVAAWVNQDFHLSYILKSNDKQSRGFMHNVCGKLLCPAEWDWGNDRVKARIRERTTDYIISENSWPLFVYENYSVSSNDLEQGLFKSKILVQAFKATFTSLSSTREADGDGNGANILENNRRAQRALNQVKVKMCVRFALSSISSWCTIDGDFDYEAFWNNIVDFFEDVPGPIAQRRVNKLLEWWTRKIFGRNHHEDLMAEVVSHMSVTTLAEQRRILEDATFDSD